MKKTLLGLFMLSLLFSSAQAEMYWFGLNPNAQAGNAGDSGQVTLLSYPSFNQSNQMSDGSFEGFEVELKIVDSSAGTISADSSYGTYYTTCLNTEDVLSATGLFELVSITDTSTDTGHLFALAGDSTFVSYTLKTGYVPYDANALELVAATVVSAVSGAAARDALTLTFEGDEGLDSLFKPYTWFEFTCWDSTRWGARTSGPFDSSITGTWVLADTVALSGTYGGSGALGRYHIRIFDPGSDKDSIISTFYGPTTVVDTTAITESAQALPDGIDSGVTITFDDDDTGTNGDVFIFHVSDSLHYGKTVKYKMRAGLNVHKRK